MTISDFISLPDELIITIIYHLHPSSYGPLTATCKLLSYLASNERIRYIKLNFTVQTLTIGPFKSKTHIVSFHKQYPIIRNFFPPHVNELKKFLNLYNDITDPYIHLQVYQYNNEPYFEGEFKWDKTVESRDNKKYQVKGYFKNNRLNGDYYFRTYKGDIPVTYNSLTFLNGKAEGHHHHTNSYQIIITEYKDGHKINNSLKYAADDYNFTWTIKDISPLRNINDRNIYEGIKLKSLIEHSTNNDIIYWYTDDIPLRGNSVLKEYIYDHGELCLKETYVHDNNIKLLEYITELNNYDEIYSKRFSHTDTYFKLKAEKERNPGSYQGIYQRFGYDKNIPLDLIPETREVHRSFNIKGKYIMIDYDNSGNISVIGEEDISGSTVYIKFDNDGNITEEERK